MENYNSNSEYQLTPLQRPAFVAPLVPAQSEEDRLLSYVERLEGFAEIQEDGFRNFILELLDDVYEVSEETVLA